MPAQVSEISSGRSESRSGGTQPTGGGSARSNDSLSRAFRILLNSPTEVVNFQAAAGVTLGQAHPSDANMVATTYDSRYDGESRMVVVVTFRYTPRPSQQDQEQPPEQRPANWSIGSATQEVPAQTWKPRDQLFGWGANWVPAANVVGDMYDGVTKLEPIVRISISQFETDDPTDNLEYVGSLNEEEITLGTLTIKPHQLLFTGLQQAPTVEKFGDVSRRGWQGTYEFSYKKNEQTVRIQGLDKDVDIGWDIAVPQTGFNCRAFDPKVPNAADDIFGQPLKHGDKGSKFYGKIIPPPEGYSLPDGVNAADKVRCMVRVFSFQGGGESQTPSAQPIALNDDGRPRLVDPAAGVRPLVYAYQVYRSINITNALGLRLF